MVAGASSGIGAAQARRWVREGPGVVAIERGAVLVDNAGGTLGSDPVERAHPEAPQGLHWQNHEEVP